MSARGVSVAMGWAERGWLVVATLLMTCLLGVHTQPARAANDAHGVTVVALRIEYSVNPLGIDTRAPRLSWQLRASRRGVSQSAYQIQVASSPSDLETGKNLLWDSGKVVSGESIFRPYGGPPLESMRRYYWRVQIWDERDDASGWSEPAFWEMGLLAESDWKADWVTPALAETASADGPSPLLRKSFQLRRAVRSARAYVTSHGLYELYLNDHRVGDELFTPGWTSYNKRLQYQTFDVADLLRKGGNAVGLVLGDGWYRGRAWEDVNHYGESLAALLQIHVIYDDGSDELLGTDATWKSSTGPIRMSEIYAGETYDARLEKQGWATASYNDTGWSGVTVIPSPKSTLVAPVGPPVRRIELLQPVRIFTTPAGDTVADFGQNMVGWVRLKVKGPAGTTVVLRHAEVLDSRGNFYTANLRTARQEVRYTLKGEGQEVYEPHFTFQGFRYVTISGYPGRLTPDELTGMVIHSDMSRTGQLETSNKLVNQLYHNIVWGQKGNFVDVPTDCPQRDERMGWTGDAEVFSTTAALNMGVAGFFQKWLADLSVDQAQDGRVPFVIPDAIHPPGAKVDNGAAGWGDAATVIPWNLYQAYGDVGILEQQYPSMAKWVEYERTRAGEGLVWQADQQFGDWLDFFGAAKHTNFGSTSSDMVATAYFAHSTDILRRAAEVLGKRDDAVRYAQLLEQIKAAFRARFVTADGVIAEGTQTAYVLALDFNLLPESLQPVAAARLARDVRSRGHLTTGFLGTPHLLDVLTRYGYLHEAYGLFNREEFPSWLYPVKHGATTIWERWDGIKPDGSFEDDTMNSFNHYAYGAVGEWMYQVMLGIKTDPDAPGYRHILIEPRPGDGLTRMKGSYETPFGRLSVEWATESEPGRPMSLWVEVPPNTRATVRLPGTRVGQVRESGAVLARAPGVSGMRQDAGAVVVEVGSGAYRFNFTL